MKRILLGMMVGLLATATLSVAQNAISASAKTIDNAPADSTNQIQLQQRNPRYAIRAGDSFDINFELSPEFNQAAVVVQPDGFITLKSVGDIHVAGETVPQLTKTLHDAYDKILNDPPVSVVMKDFEKPYFTAIGQLNHPGKYDLRGDVTLTEAVAIAGGFTDNAKHSQVVLFRRVNEDWTHAKIYNVKQMLKAGNLHEDPSLHPGDMVYVPQNTLSKIKPFIPNSGLGAYVPITR
ncbi:MAG: polysaccharide biosynthesis/export family protein [Candidatus Sulfotelmatobacter sp.]